MKRSDWYGVMPAITTPLAEDGTIDYAFLAKHVVLLVDAGSRAIVTPGSLGEANTLSVSERELIWETCVEAVANRVPVVAAISALATASAVDYAERAQVAGCRGLMVLPPYAYVGSWRESKAHFAAVFNATPLSCMLYNNPIAYGTDTLPEHVAQFAADHSNLHAVKESSGDIRRFRALKGLLGDRLALFVGIDDMIVEGIDAGAVGWIAGLVNALPEESIRLYDLAINGPRDEMETLYQWFLPLLRLDAVPEFVQLVNLVQQEFGMGSERVRLPRLPVEGPIRDHALAVIAEAKRTLSKP
jgi:4-hydroxy-tetrahydrodipicolinate synthase